MLQIPDHMLISSRRRCGQLITRGKITVRRQAERVGQCVVLAGGQFVVKIGIKNFTGFAVPQNAMGNTYAVLSETGKRSSKKPEIFRRPHLVEVKTEMNILAVKPAQEIQAFSKR